MLSKNLTVIIAAATVVGIFLAISYYHVSTDTLSDAILREDIPIYTGVIDTSCSADTDCTLSTRGACDDVLRKPIAINENSLDAINAWKSQYNCTFEEFDFYPVYLDAVCEESTCRVRRTPECRQICEEARFGLSEFTETEIALHGFSVADCNC